MPSIGPRCHELRVNDASRTWRIIYRIDPAAIVVVEVFAKATSKREAMEAAGWASGDAGDFLGLTDEERRLVELRLAVSRAVRRRRVDANLTQQQVAAKIRSSQSRVAKIEAGAADVPLDPMFSGLFAVGGGVDDLARRRSKGPVRRPAKAKHEKAKHEKVKHEKAPKHKPAGRRSKVKAI
jgi:hypothetical protein